MRVRHFIVAAMALCLAAATATAAPATPKMIYKVDAVTVKLSGKSMLVTASGAVNSGGWTAAHLRLREAHRPESDTAVVDFLATPPSASEVVIQALIPVTVSATFSLPPYGTVQVQVTAQTNSVTAPIR